MTTLSFQIQNLSCAGCVGRTERALTTVPGVAEARVNLATQRADVDYGGPATPAAIAQALDEAGYPAEIADVALALTGLHCASCVSRVEAALKTVPGVVSASVNLANETARVTAFQDTALTGRLTQAVKDAGFGAEIQGALDSGARKAGEADRVRRDALLASALTLPVFVLEMGGHMVPAFHHWIAQTIGMQASWVIQFILTTLVLAGPGRRFFVTGIPALLRGAPEMNSLVVLGTSAAWGYSVVATFLPGVLPEGTRAVYFEAAAVITTLILFGRALEARAKGQAGAAIAKLVGLRPATARRLTGTGSEEVSLDQIVPGDLLQVRPGEQLPVDGKVQDGGSYVNEAMITGEPVPVAKGPGDDVIGGTVNGTGALTYRATAVGEDTILARIIRMVEDAQAAKLPIQALVDRVTSVFVPVVIGVAVLTIATWLLFGPDPALGLALVAGVSVLIIACPCAMGLATPTSILVGTGRGAELGVLFRKGDALQRLEGARVVAFDKTGTLTEGRPQVTALHLAEGADEATTLSMLAAVEAFSEHPLAQAVVRAAEARGLTPPKATDFTSDTGLGVRGMVNGGEVRIGSARYLEGSDISVGELADKAKAIAAKEQTPVFAAIGSNAVAVLGVADPIKAQTSAAIDALHAQGLKVAMITGDARPTAKSIAAELGIDHVVAEVLPDGKAAAIEALRANAGPVAFVGDGINDAPALAAADVGIAIGTGTDVAIEAADVVLISGQLTGVVNALTISKATMANIRQNLFWAFAYNTALIPVAAGILYPVAGTLLSPVLAAGAMALSSVFVVTNALRLRRVQPALAETPPNTPMPALEAAE